MKIPFVNFELYTKAVLDSSIHENKTNTIEEPTSFIQTNSRSSTVINPFIGKVIAVYTGRRSKRVLITPEMVGYKLGCFAFTKKMGKSIHNSEHNRKKIAKMRRKITQRKVRKISTKTAPKKKSKKKK